jgi:hypothetical protein
LTTAQHHSIIGLPKTGKTTFLAALWHLIDAGEVSTKLVLDKLVGDHHHLNSLVDAWRKCEEVKRTSIAAETTVSIHFHEPATGHRAVLDFPDLSGESFERQLTTRSCPESYVATFTNRGGILLFLTAERAQDGITIVDLAPVLVGAPDSERSSSMLREWTAQAVPEAVRLVELLQFLQGPPFERRLRKVAVIVSAWDLVVGSQCQPDEWLARELPLLHQFLAANPDSFKSRVYGISAQGGDVRGQRRAELLRMTPSERIACVGPETEPHDLTSPILWLTSEE